ncbi:MAG: FtsX-like permease family protein [Treponema sp.]|jgi:ABC-type lipoprotein release transport system permease subunit|nr:FtsX-like permease family protein [Treponema sp.]
MIWLLILRNIIRNKKNSAVIITLISSITFLFFIGNSFLGRSDQGLREAYVECLTGDVVIQKRGNVSMNLFGANTPIIDSFFSIPPLPAYDMVKEIVSAEPGVSMLSSQVSGTAVVDLCAVREIAPLCGVDALTYFDLFNGIILEEGRFLQSGEFGVMITRERAERIKRQTGTYPAIGDPVLLTAGAEAGFKIREVPLLGIYRYRNSGQFMNEVVITDPQTIRVLNSIMVASMEFDAAEDALGLLDAGLEDLFNTGEDTALSVPEDSFSAESLESFLESFEDAAEPEALVGGDWNFIILRLEKGVSPVFVIASLNKKLENYGVTAVGWRIAAGQSAILLLLIQSLFNGGIFIVSVAGIIAAVNILLISLFKRTREIGTLRAMGAHDSHIRFLVMGENIILAFIAGTAGILAGYGAIRIVNSLALHIPNVLVGTLLGGEILSLSFLPGAAVLSFLVAVFLGAASSVYPVEMAVHIDPVVAVRQG